MPQVDMTMDQIMEAAAKAENDAAVQRVAERMAKINAQPRDYLVQKTTGTVYPMHPILRQRDDMVPAHGPMKDSEEVAARIVAEHKARMGEIPMNIPNKPVGDGRIESVMRAIEQLTPGDPQHFTTDGLPRVEAIESMLGDDLAPGERNDAWNRLQRG